jgi:hypothetical protein
MKTGRNDPCPCGSGKKFKRCCLSPAIVVSGEFQELIAGQEFNSLKEVQALADQFTQQRNQQPQDDFQGLMSEQVYRMLNFPFDSPQFFSFSKILVSEPEAPILTLARWIIDAIDKKGLKATAKGNLPQKLCRNAALDFWKGLSDDDIHHRIRVNKEDDFMDLHVTRIILELSGLLRKTKGCFFLTRKYHQFNDQSERAALYPKLFQTCCREFNWGYWDRYPEIPFIQQSFLFTLYLLRKYGDEWKPSGFYVDAFIKAFPMVVDEVESPPYFTAEEEIRNCYGLRVLQRFLQFMGLVSIEKIPSEKPFSREYRIRKLPLLYEVVCFSV